MITGGGAQLIGLENVDPGGDRHAGAPGEAPAVLGGPRLGSVPRELRRAAAGPELLAPGLTAPVGAREHRGRLSARPASAVDAGPARDHVARPDLPRRAGLGVINSARTAAQDVVSPLQDLADDVINPVDRLVRRPRAGQRAPGRERQAAPAARRGRAPRSRRTRRRRCELADLRAIARPPRHRRRHRDRRVWSTARARATSRARSSISKGSTSGIAVDMPVVVGAATRRAFVGRVARGVGERARSCNASTTRSFGVGAQLMQPDTVGPPGHRARDSATATCCASRSIDNSTTAIVLNEGRLAVITLGGEPTDLPARARRSAPSCARVDAGGAIARDAQLQPVVDLDALTSSRCCRYPPAPIP